MASFQSHKIGFAGSTVVLLGAATFFALGEAGLSAAPTPDSPLNAQVTVRELPSPATEGSTQPWLASDAAGRLHLIWTERKAGAEPAIRYSMLAGSSWSEPSTVTSGRGIVASSADLPSVLVLPSGRLVAHWQQSATAGGRSYGVRLAQSSDGGASWSTPVTPHSSHESGENGFVSLFARTGDSAAAVWLDGRNFGRAGAPRRPETMLISAGFAKDGGLGTEQVISSRVCDCCQTSTAATNKGQLLAFRGRTSEEIRDIEVARFNGVSWSTPRTVAADNWQINSCPVNGPDLDALGNEVAVAWFTAARDTTKVQIAFSSDAGDTFTAPLRIDSGDPVGRVSVVLTGTRSAWVAWMERGSTYESRILVRRVVNGRLSGEAVSVTPTGPTFASGFPSMVRRGPRGDLVFAWTTTDGPGGPPRIRLATVGIPD